MSEVVDFGKARRHRAYEELRARVKRGEGEHSALALEAAIIGIRSPDSLPRP